MLFKIFLASFVSGLLSAMGFGSGTVLIVWLTTFMNYGQLQAQGVNLLFFIPCAALALFLLYRKGLVSKTETLPLTVGGTVGIIAGQLLLSSIPTEYLSKLFGVFIIVLSLKQLFSIRKSRTE
ncbi:MAG: sulfite exporter TauE/SafE family protein [Clostridia bacterium]|nr:sulfite exporter TauE/SafE family protein [Clostridia bacterium]